MAAELASALQQQGDEWTEKEAGWHSLTAQQQHHHQQQLQVLQDQLCDVQQLLVSTADRAVAAEQQLSSTLQQLGDAQGEAATVSTKQLQLQEELQASQAQLAALQGQLQAQADSLHRYVSRVTKIAWRPTFGL